MSMNTDGQTRIGMFDYRVKESIAGSLKTVDNKNSVFIDQVFFSPWDECQEWKQDSRIPQKHSQVEQCILFDPVHLI